MDLTKTFSPEVFGAALESWAWIGLEAVQPVVANLFGDVFFIGQDGWWFLDTMEGSLTRNWKSRDELVAEINSEAGQDQYLLGGLAIAAHNSGLVLSESQVYDFMPPLILGGQARLENITVMDFTVKVHITGQLHDQIRHLPAGTPISGVELS